MLISEEKVLSQLQKFIGVALETGPVVSSNWLNQEVVVDGDMTYT